jgi:hypothetical protein
MPGTLASLLIKLGLDATGVEQGIARTQRSLVGLSSGTGMAMRSAGTVIGSGLSLAAHGALEMEGRAARIRAETGACGSLVGRRPELTPPQLHCPPSVATVTRYRSPTVDASASRSPSTSAASSTAARMRWPTGM